MSTQASHGGFDWAAGDAAELKALVRRNARWLLLLVASYGFYALWQREPLLLLAASTLLTYAAGLELGAANPARRRVLVLAIVYNLGTLAAFKYTNFFLGSLNLDLPALTLVLPIGLSFYTFSAVSYLVDVYRGTMEPERHPGRFALYVAFFPKMLAGPIERAATFLPQLRASYAFAPEQVTAGLQLLAWGLFKKFVIADRLATLVDPAFASPGFSPVLGLWIAVYLYAFQIYCDFSGYTDMARGAAKLFGFDLMENFARPYLSRSPSEFWSRRWHLSLATWFRDYLYFPLGGSRVHWLRRGFNLMAVFAVSGLWHGANWTFVAWGALNGLYVCAGTATAPLWRRAGERLPRFSTSAAWTAVRMLFTFHLVAFAWIFFRASSFGDAWTILKRLWQNAPALPTMLKAYAWPGEVLLSLALIGLLVAFELFDERRNFWRWLGARPRAVRWGFYYLLLLSLVVLGNWGAPQFIYMQF